MPLIVDREYVLKRVTQEKIFERYGVPYRTGMFRSILREDRHPTCSFYYKDGKLYLRDFSGDFWGDCFDLVQRIHNVRYGGALDIIARDFDLNDGSQEIIDLDTQVLPDTRRVEIRVKRRKWSRTTSGFWKEHGITKRTVDKFKVYPAEMVWLDGTPYYKYHPSNPAYIYHWTGYNYQIYFPNERKPRPRFLSSDSRLIHGFEQLPLTGQVCVITKSRKDVMCLHEFGIPAIASMGESILVPEDIIQILFGRFNRVVSLMDYDNTGIRNALALRSLYNIKPLFFTEKVWTRGKGYKGAKDFAEYVKLYKRELTEKLIDYVRSSSASAYT